MNILRVVFFCLFISVVSAHAAESLKQWGQSSKLTS